MADAPPRILVDLLPRLNEPGGGMLAFPLLPPPWTTAAVAAGASFALCPLLARLAPRLGLMDEPDEGRKKHGRAVPLVGGIAVWIGAGVALWLTGVPGGLQLWVASAAMGAVGVLDDLLDLRPSPKLWLQFGAVPAAVLLVFLLNAPSLRELERWVRLAPEMIAFLAALSFCVVLLTNAVNFTDNSNGQCAGLAAIILAAFALFFHSADAAVSGPLGAFSGACVGFLPWNYPRGRIFLGDGGSHLLGFVIGMAAYVGVLAAVEQPGQCGSMFRLGGVLLLLAIPLLDMAIAVGGRLRRGQAPWKGDLTHLYHRLVARGWQPAVAVAVLWLAAIVASAAGVLVLLR